MSDAALLPRRRPIDVTADPAVIDFDEAGVVFDALAADTAREILGVVYESPGPPSEIAEAVDTSLQNVIYHLDRLTEAGLVTADGVWYSSKGIEMDVYAPAFDPLVIRLDARSERDGPPPCGP